MLTRPDAEASGYIRTSLRDVPLQALKRLAKVVAELEADAWRDRRRRVDDRIPVPAAIDPMSGGESPWIVTLITNGRQTAVRTDNSISAGYPMKFMLSGRCESSVGDCESPDRG